MIESKAHKIKLSKDEWFFISNILAENIRLNKEDELNSIKRTIGRKIGRVIFGHKYSKFENKLDYYTPQLN